MFVGSFVAVFVLLFLPSYHLDIPEHFPPMEYDLSQNPLSTEAITLGRALFYDPILSADGTVSCASCHSPYNAFAHTDHDLSHGIADRIGRRNAPALFNLGWQQSYMWDGAIHHLDMQALAPISSHTEMDNSLASVIDTLSTSSYYVELFFAAFGDSTITGERFLKSLSQFQLTLISSGSRYDDMRSGHAEFSTQEQNGYRLFLEHCNSCHTEPLFTNLGFADNGLAIDSTLRDLGRMEVTGYRDDSLLFKVPSLRNLKYSRPYMHDGRYATLRDVLSHYAEEVILRPAFSDRNRIAHSIEMTANERTDLISFLRTLDDEAFVFNAAHHYPRNQLGK